MGYILIALGFLHLGAGFFIVLKESYIEKVITKTVYQNRYYDIEKNKQFLVAIVPSGEEIENIEVRFKGKKEKSTEGRTKGE